MKPIATSLILLTTSLSSACVADTSDADLAADDLAAADVAADAEALRYGPWKPDEDVSFSVQPLGPRGLLFFGVGSSRSRSYATCEVVAREGTCSTEVCEGPSYAEIDPAYAGVASVVRRGASPVTVDATAPSEHYFDATSFTERWVEGRRYRLTTSGAGPVPPVDLAVKLVADELAVLSPTAPAGGRLVVSRRAPFVAEWVPPRTGGTVQLYIRSWLREVRIPEERGGWPADNSTVRCTFDARDGVGVVPASILEPLHPHERNAEVSLSLTRTSEVKRRGWHISFVAEGGGVSSDARVR